MATRDDIYQAIRNADKAGDSESVKKLAAYLQTMDAGTPAPAPAAPPASLTDKIRQGAGNLAAGAVRGAGSIGATLLEGARSLGAAATEATPANMRPAVTAGAADLPRSAEMRGGMDAGLKAMGADPNALLFKGGKLTGEVAGTAGAGNLLRLGGATGPLADAIGSGGFSGGGNALVRAAGGAINGGATAGLANPEDAGKGALFGGVLPGAVQLAGKAGGALYDAAQAGARRLMQSAIKPTIAQLKSGDADTAVQTLLEYGISPTKEGVNKLKALVDDLNNQIKTKISGSTATVDKGKVLDKLDDVRSQFSKQVSPGSDLRAIEGVADDFAAHPSFPLPQTQIPVQAAQEMKQGTYKVLAKKYGQVGTAETEAQKGLARGLKEEVANAVPGVQALNAEESRLLTTLSVAERRALLEMNKNPVGLTALAHNPIAAAGFLADRSAAFKALAARLINNAAVPAAGYAGQKAIAGAGNPLLRAAGVDAISANP
jgi:hypothetical protein